ncbi:hypothetical protein [Peptacetobacter sp.]|uniref:hypothetical protein n=1 Tax=Peptacetobacter sp. TaxID=2991975 RepID=UPI00262179F3|nr:hypothetical protein [Peptacetobacter sp.]
MNKIYKYRHQVTAIFWGVILCVMLFLYKVKETKISAVAFLTVAILMFTSLKYAKVVADYEKQNKEDEKLNKEVK